MAERGRPRKKIQYDFTGWKYEKIIGYSTRKKVFDIYPHLKIYPELDPKKFKNLRISFDRVLRYVMIYYSNNSLRKAIPEVAHRKREAAFLAGFKLIAERGRFGNDVEAVLQCTNPLVNQMIIRFLRRSENKKFMQLCVFEEARAKQMQKLIDGVSDKDKELTQVVIKNVKTLSEDIENLENDMLNEDVSQNLLDILYDEIDYSNLGLSPEEIAEAQREGTTKEILGNPYIHRHDGFRNLDSKVRETSS